ncbi:MAG: magnesium transporter [Clostridia bacterium]|nr:magnesium transporter [Clostridia bacterium]
MENIINLLDEKKYALVRSILIDMNAIDIAELMEELNDEHILILYRLLPKDLSAEVFTNMESEMQEIIIQSITDKEISDLIELLFIDDTVDFIEELPANVVKRVLSSTNPEKRRLINQFLNYPEDSAGSIMTIEFMELKKDMTVGESIERIRRIGINKETVNTCYITGQNRLLEGEITLKDLVLADDEVKIKDIMSLQEDLIFITTDMDAEDVSNLFRKYSILSMPVVDSEKRLVGIITVDDILDVVQEEVSEDIEKMAAILPLEEEYMKASLFDMAKKRIVWLLVLMITATFTQAIIRGYDNLLAANVMLAAYIPMLMGTGGNAGSQASTLIIRGLALGDIEMKDFFKIVFKEARISFMVGSILAVINFIKMYFIDRPDNIFISVAVSISLIITVMIAKIVGGSLPIIAKKLKLDPAVMAAPLITTIVDAVTVLIYFSIAMALLSI